MGDMSMEGNAWKICGKVTCSEKTPVIKKKKFRKNKPVKIPDKV